jgi:hypothetical protein
MSTKSTEDLVIDDALSILAEKSDIICYHHARLVATVSAVEISVPDVSREEITEILLKHFRIHTQSPTLTTFKV